MHAFPRAYVLRQVVNHSTKKITRFSLYFVVCPFFAIKARPKTPYTREKFCPIFTIRPKMGACTFVPFGFCVQNRKV